MNKKEIFKALEFLKEQRKVFTAWIVEHPTHPYASKIASDVRHFEYEEDKLLKLYAAVYPTLEDVKALAGKELMLIFRALEKPETPEQMAVYQHVDARIKQYAQGI